MGSTKDSRRNSSHANFLLYMQWADIVMKSVVDLDEIADALEEETGIGLRRWKEEQRKKVPGRPKLKDLK